MSFAEALAATNPVQQNPSNSPMEVAMTIGAIVFYAVAMWVTIKMLGDDL